MGDGYGDYVEGCSWALKSLMRHLLGVLRVCLPSVRLVSTKSEDQKSEDQKSVDLTCLGGVRMACRHRVVRLSVRRLVLGLFVAEPSLVSWGWPDEVLRGR